MNIRNIVLYSIFITFFLSGCRSSEGGGSDIKGPAFSRNPMLLGQVIPGTSEETQNQHNGIRPSSPQAMGDWESSGGDGVVCGSGNSEEIKILDEWEFLSNSTDYETQYDFSSYFSGEKLTPYEFTSGMTGNEILEFVFTRLWELTPLFGQRLVDLNQRFPLKDWVATEEDIEVNDSQPIAELPSECKLVQIANRKTLSTEGQVPETKIYYNKSLFDRLNEFQKAMLMTHEFIYLLAKEGGHPTSDSIRRLIAFVFSKEFHDVDVPSEGSFSGPYRAMSFRQVLDPPFGDYMRFFLQDDVYGVDSSDNPIYKATIELMNFFRAKMKTCLGEDFDSLPDSQDKRRTRGRCQSEVFSDQGVYTDLSPEANFVYVTRFVDDRDWLRRTWNSEWMSLPKKSMLEERDSDWLGLVEKSCEHLDNNTDFQFMEHQEKAKLFCRNLDIEVSLLSERDVTRNYSCVTDPLMFHSGQSESMLVYHVSDPMNGVYVVHEFSKPFEIVEESIRSVWKEHGYRNREFYADFVFKFAVDSADDLLNLQFLVQNNPDIIERVTDQNGEKIDSGQWSIIGSTSEVSHLQIKTDCFVRELTANKEAAYIR